MHKRKVVDISHLVKLHGSAKHSRKKVELALAIASALIDGNSLVHQSVDSVELDSALSYLKEAENIAIAKGWHRVQLECAIQRAVCLRLLAKRQEALAVMRTAEEQFGTDLDPLLHARYLLVLGQLLHGAGEVTNALSSIERALHEFEALANDRFVMEAAHSMTKAYRELGDFTKAFHHCSRALNIALENNDPNLGSYYLELGIICYLMDDREKAWEIVERAEQSFNAIANKRGLVGVLQARANFLNYNSRFDESLIVHQECLRLAEECGALTGRMFLSLGDVYCGLRDFDKAIECFERARKFANENSDRALSAYSGRYLATAFIACERYDEAETVLLDCLNYLQEHFESAPEFSAIYPLLSQIAEHRSDFKQALEYHKLYHRWRERVRDSQIEQSVRLEKHNLEVERAAREREEFKSKALELEQVLREKRAEVAALAIALSQKNEVIDHLHHQIKLLSKSHDNSRKSACEKIVNEIEFLKQSGQQQWIALQQQIQSVDVDFQKRLMAQHAKLSPIEVRICLLIRLNLSTKDIANIMWCSTRTVETHRYSVRKKLGLDRDANLYSYIAGL